MAQWLISLIVWTEDSCDLIVLITKNEVHVNSLTDNIFIYQNIQHSLSIKFIRVFDRTHLITIFGNKNITIISTNVK